MHTLTRTVAALSALSLSAALAAAPPVAADARYAYGTSSFGTFVADSYRLTGGDPADFARWLTTAYAAKDDKLAGHESASFEEALDARARELAATKLPAARATLELQTASWLHRVVKQTIPRFSLDRGFEFTSAATANGERQCLLQSVLIAGLLQKMGITAGVDMVWANPQGERSNMGHAVASMRLSDGRDVLVDASDPTPFIQHQGLFVRLGAVYRFVQPQYAQDATITGYQDLEGRRYSVAQTRPLDADYLRSQFYYYRGERTPGGFFDAKKTAAGLNSSVAFFKTALKYNPHNPLATYALGRVLTSLGQTGEARTYLGRGMKLYEAQGYVPQGPKDAYAAAMRTDPKPGT